MSEYGNIEEYIAARNKALVELDVEWGRASISAISGGYVDEQVIMAALHKARYEVPAIPPTLRRESREWLEAHGFSRLLGQPWPEGDELPE